MITLNTELDCDKSWNSISMSSTRLKNRYDGSKKNIDVEPKAGTFDIGNIETQAIIEFQLGATDNLPKARKSRHDVQTVSVPELIRFSAKRSRARPNQAHFTF